MSSMPCLTVVELIYKKPLEEIDKFLKKHREFLQKYYDEGVLIVSGPKDPRDGGIILARADKETMSVLIKEDPFYQNDIADYKFIQFDPVKCCGALLELLR